MKDKLLELVHKVLEIRENNCVKIESKHKSYLIKDRRKISDYDKDLNYIDLYGISIDFILSDMNKIELYSNISFKSHRTFHKYQYSNFGFTKKELYYNSYEYNVITFMRYGGIEYELTKEENDDLINRIRNYESNLESSRQEKLIKIIDDQIKQLKK